MQARRVGAERVIGTYFDEGFWRSSNPRGVRRAGNHHRTISHYLTDLIDLGFALAMVAEPLARDPNVIAEQPHRAALPPLLLDMATLLGLACIAGDLIVLAVLAQLAAATLDQPGIFAAAAATGSLARSSAASPPFAAATHRALPPHTAAVLRVLERPSREASAESTGRGSTRWPWIGPPASAGVRHERPCSRRVYHTSTERRAVAGLLGRTRHTDIVETTQDDAAAQLGPEDAAVLAGSASGIGRELGWSGIAANTEEKTVRIVL